MKLSPIQVAASAIGAVLAAVIASFFGVQGTVIGVAVGSVVATTVSAFAGESIRRTHQAVHQVVVKNADQLPFLHRDAPTSAAGTVTAATTAGSVDAVVETPAPSGPSADTTPAEASLAPGDAERPRDAAPADVTGAPVREPEAAGPVTAGVAQGGGTPSMRFLASSRSGRTGTRDRGAGGGTSAVPPADGRSEHPRIVTLALAHWKALALSVVIVFASGLAVVTVMEALAGRPLSSLFGSNGASSGTSAGNWLTGTPPPSTTTTSTSTSTTTTTTTTVPSSTSTTSPPPSTTTTTTPATSTTTTTVPGNTGTTPAPAAG